MKLVAMMMVHNEADRFLDVVLEHLNGFCDEIRAFDDGSTDDTAAILEKHGALVCHSDNSVFYQHEGRARNALLDFTLAGQPTHILAIDADEMVENGQEIRRHLEQRTSPSGVWNLWMEEIWKADETSLFERVDGRWGNRKTPSVFEAVYRRSWRISDRALSSGREPVPVAKAGIRSRQAPICSIFHFGWTCERDRAARYQRYVIHDGGKHHDDGHLKSIMFPDSQVKLKPRPWPGGLEAYRPRLLDRINA